MINTPTNTQIKRKYDLYHKDIDVIFYDKKRNQKFRVKEIFHRPSTGGLSPKIVILDNPVLDLYQEFTYEYFTHLKARQQLIRTGLKYSQDQPDYMLTAAKKIVKKSA